VFRFLFEPFPGGPGTFAPGDLVERFGINLEKAIRLNSANRLYAHVAAKSDVKLSSRKKSKTSDDTGISLPRRNYLLHIGIQATLGYLLYRYCYDRLNGLGLYLLVGSLFFFLTSYPIALGFVRAQNEALAKWIQASKRIKDA